MVNKVLPFNTQNFFYIVFNLELTKINNKILLHKLKFKKVEVLYHTISTFDFLYKEKREKVDQFKILYNIFTIFHFYFFSIQIGVQTSMHMQTATFTSTTIYMKRGILSGTNFYYVALMHLTAQNLRSTLS